MFRLLKVIFLIIAFAPSGVFAFSQTDVVKMAEQSIIIGFRGATFSDKSEIRNLLLNTNPGGVILFDYDSPSKGKMVRNFVSQRQLTSLIRNIKNSEKSQIPIFVSIDQEGGRVNRLKAKYGFRTQTITAKKRGELGLARTATIENLLVRQVRNAGFNLNFGTVADLDFGKDSVAIGKFERSYSKDRKTVFDFVLQNIDIHKRNSVLGTVKHYPGHGSANKDTHTDFVDVTHIFKQDEVLVFKDLAKFVDAIMVAHIVDQNVDTLPASLSRAHINKLRNEFGFNGLIITDDLDMSGIKKEYTLQQAVVMAKSAGVDMVIISNNIESYDKNAFYKARDAIVDAVNQGTISYDELKASYDRILLIKKKYNI